MQPDSITNHLLFQGNHYDPNHRYQFINKSIFDVNLDEHFILNDSSLKEKHITKHVRLKLNYQIKLYENHRLKDRESHKI